MPSALTYPGVYVEEVPSGVRTITGVATSITAFVGRAPRGPVDSDAVSPVRLTSYADYERHFGGLSNDSPMSFSVYQYFNNGGSDALIVRVHNAAVAAQTPALPAAFLFQAANPGSWGNGLRLRVDHDVPAEVAAANPPNTLFNLRVKDMGTQAVENFLNLSITAGHPRFVGSILAQQSRLLRAAATVAARPAANTVPATPPADLFADASSTALAGGTDGSPVTGTQISGGNLRAGKRGLYALEKADLFNLLVLPPLSDAVAASADIGNATWADAIAYATERRALVLVDPPFHTSGWDDISDLTPDAVTGVAGRSANAALFFPRIRAANPLREGRLEAFAPAGAVAGVIARTDGARGVWKSAAGIEATLNGVPALDVPMTDRENGLVNPLGVNCLRSFPNTGAIVWGARTLRGADALASEWKYMAVRRTALFLEESLFRGTQWVVFEPNDEPLWAQIRLNVGAFLQNLFRQGAFQGRTPREAYFVRCDSSTTTQADIDLGIVNILVGFAPLKPAEFVVLKLQQIAGELAA
jgi:phage tail sheath protein FI